MVREDKHYTKSGQRVGSKEVLGNGKRESRAKKQKRDCDIFEGSDSFFFLSLNRSIALSTIIHLDAWLKFNTASMKLSDLYG